MSEMQRLMEQGRQEIVKDLIAKSNLHLKYCPGPTDRCLFCKELKFLCSNFGVAYPPLIEIAKTGDKIVKNSKKDSDDKPTENFSHGCPSCGVRWLSCPDCGKDLTKE